ncbi:MAG: hypothetical protein ACK53Y_15570, partial [bacterium]
MPQFQWETFSDQQGDRSHDFVSTTAIQMVQSLRTQSGFPASTDRDALFLVGWHRCAQDDLEWEHRHADRSDLVLSVA